MKESCGSTHKTRQSRFYNQYSRNISISMNILRSGICLLSRLTLCLRFINDERGHLLRSRKRIRERKKGKSHVTFPPLQRSKPFSQPQSVSCKNFLNMNGWLILPLVRRETMPACVFLGKKRKYFPRHILTPG